MASTPAFSPPKAAVNQIQAVCAGKLCALLVLCFSAPFALSALTHPDVSIFVSPVAGNGLGEADNFFFYNQIVSELMGWEYRRAETRREADYTLNPRIAPDMENLEQYTPITHYTFQLELHDNRADVSLVEFGLVYDDLEGIDIMITSLLYTILSVIPDDPVPVRTRVSALPSPPPEEEPPPPAPPAVDNTWRNKWLYLGLGAFWTPRVYDGEGQSTHLVNFGAGLMVDLHFLNFMTLGGSVELAPDWVTVSVDPVAAADNYRNLILEFPLYLKLVFKPGAYYMLEPYGGVHLNLSMYDATKPPLFSWMAGIQYGVKAGGGVLFVEPRFSMDIGKSSVNSENYEFVSDFQRYVIHIGIGYKYGFVEKWKNPTALPAK